MCLFSGLVGLAEEYSFSFFWTMPTAIAAASTDIAGLLTCLCHLLGCLFFALDFIKFLMYYCNKRRHLNSYLKKK